MYVSKILDALVFSKLIQNDYFCATMRKGDEEVHLLFAFCELDSNFQKIINLFSEYCLKYLKNNFFGHFAFADLRYV